MSRRSGVRFGIVGGLSAVVAVGVLAGPATSTTAPTGCGPGVPERAFSVSAIDVDITLNRFGDFDPDGAMYVLDSEIDRVRAQERSQDVTPGLRGDAIQPLVLRGNLGECLVVRFTNRLRSSKDEVAPRVSLRPAGLSYDASSSGDGVGNNGGTDSSPRAGATTTYRFFLDPRNGEGVHAFHSGGASRELTSHGLFGAIVAEPAGSAHLDPRTGAPGADTGWEAIIDPPHGPAFREFALLYHEVGNEQFALGNHRGNRLPMNDSSNPANQRFAGTPASGAYRPGTRAINYRSEPFMRRMDLASPSATPAGPRVDPDGRPLDKSGLYSTYTFGDPATPIAHSYLGEPTKTRLVNAGSEMAHVHHLHGGGTRWRRNPAADDTRLAAGLQKAPGKDARSIRLDSQTVSPGESFTLEHECGAGGCQQAAGDFLQHCHIAQHYVAGMWGMWRVFDTRQADLAALPGREAPPAPVTSDELVGREIGGRKVVPASKLVDPRRQRSLEELVESQLPPQGTRTAWDDATVWDYIKGGTADAPRYRGEPEDTRSWPGYTSPTPGRRQDILFNPRNGRYAWPLLRPHLAARPPFSPKGHSAAPWLGPDASAQRPDGLCPADAPVKRFDITALPVRLQTTRTTADPDGQVYVLNEDREDVEAGRRRAEPLAIRANVGDCVDITLSSALRDTEEAHGYSKVNMHTHLVQFDPSASDGVVTGSSYEQTIRPYASESRTLTEPAAAGADRIVVSKAAGLRPGVGLAVGQGDADIEVRVVEQVLAGGVVTLDRPLERSHERGESAGVEFARYRWFVDVDTGTVFWHDHVDGINSWDRGLYGALVVEPKGSTYHDPETGAEVRSGPIADVRTQGSVGAGQRGSFRELVCILHDGIRNDPNAGTLANGVVFRQGGSINHRAEPLAGRGGDDAPDAFSSARHGDPITPLPRAYVGDPFVVRTLGVTELQGALRITGHRFRPERFSDTVAPVDTATTGLSERFDYVLEGGAGGVGEKPGDYLYASASHNALRAGAWGLLRVHDRRRADLMPLPDRRPPEDGSGFPHVAPGGGPAPVTDDPGEPCPPVAPRRRYEIAIFRKPLPLRSTPQSFGITSLPGVPAVPVPAAPGKSQDDEGVVYALERDRQAVLDGSKPLEPLVLRANAGECVELVLHNRLPAGTRSGINLGKLPFDPQGSYGAAIGLNPDSSVAAGDRRTYRFFADRELGTSVAVDLASPLRTSHGAFGALVVEPAGSTWTDARSGKPLDSGAQADVHTPDGSFRELVALLHEDELAIGGNDGRYWLEVAGFAGLNYRQAPFADRLQGPLSSLAEQSGAVSLGVGGRLPDPKLTAGRIELKGDRSQVFSSKVHGDPPTPVFRAQAGDRLRVRVAAPAAGQWHAFGLAGHTWAADPGLPGSSRTGVQTLGPAETIDAQTVAGGHGSATGDYVLGDRRLPFTQAGLWGLLRVLPPGDPGIRPLAG